jgi:spore coat polysaccharide biosynthesis protein SpsF
VRNVVIIQARMGSTRLPGKVMKILAGKTVLAHVVERSQSFNNVQEVVIATTSGSIDDPIVEEAKRLGIMAYRGSESDVLSRYYETASLVKADHIVRITSDCPLIDSKVSSLVIQKHICSMANDYTSNTLKRTYPRGLDTEMFTFCSLETAYHEARDDHDREHVTPFIYNPSNHFNCKSVESQITIPDYRWTLDTEEDWTLISRIYEVLYQPGTLFTWTQAVNLMQEKPNWIFINSHIQQK